MRFSIVITYPEGKTAEIIESIKEMDYPKSKFEIITLPGPGSPSIYRNKGAEKGKGEIIVFLDDDAVADKELLKKADNFFKEHKEIDIVGGSQLTPLDEKGFGRISGYALSSKFGGWKTANRYGKKSLNLNADETYLTSAIMFCRKKVFKKAKFDEKLFPGEDPKFIMDAKKEGFKIAYSPDLIVYHRRRPTVKKLIKQIFNYGKVAFSRTSFEEILKQPFFLIPSLFLIYLIGLIIGLAFVPNLLLTFPLMLYFILDLIFSFFESVKNKDLIALLPLFFIFPIIHLSYGAGMISGFINKHL
jgi:succinoglycan biosynthesis protein ExoA